MSRRSVLDRPLRQNEDLGRVTFAAFSYLFCEMCSRCRTVPSPVQDITEWEERLCRLGVEVGSRLVQISAVRDPQFFKQRPIHVEAILSVISDNLWVKWFGRKSEVNKERGTDRYILVDNEPLLSKYIVMPSDYLNVDGTPKINLLSFVAGMVQGVLGSCSFPSQVTAFHDGSKEAPDRTLYCVQFEQHVVERERRNAQ